MKTVIASLLLLFITPPLFAQDWKPDFARALKNGGALVEDEKGQVLFDHRSADHFIPASTIKIATAACAIKQLGKDHRFTTEFFITQDKRLAVKGYGDPFLISEELAVIAQALKKKKLRKVNGILLDPSYFAPNIRIDKVSTSSNPYDAVNGALLANFNTIYFVKRSDGTIESAEPQTPLTPLAKKIARQHPPGKQRVNLGNDLATGMRYTGELLAEFLKLEGIDISGDITIGEIPKKSKRIYRHRSSKQLSDAVRGLFKFSTNFMANQLFLVLGAKKYDAPTTIEKGQKALTACMKKDIGWKDFKLFEGAGLSRRNSVTPKQMMQLLRKFEKHRDLLPVVRKIFQAKSGTLYGVNTLAGYFETDAGQLIRFVILVNDPVPFAYKYRLAQRLYRAINGPVAKTQSE